MTPEQWIQIDQYFIDLYELPPDERRPALAAIEDPRVRAQVESLLEHAGGQGTVENIVQSVAAGASAAEKETYPERIGPYRITGVIGHGGMGAVYQGIRDDLDYEKLVAIKVIGVSSAAPDVVNRFRQERRILASLEHPNIASLLDGGETSSGMPYIVMEFIEGVSITDYCVNHNLTTKERLRLFLQVCAAVSYAHQNLIVHRDIKPGNILVTPGGVPKLLDFGIAKLIEPGVNATMTMAQAMTPNYASPEQVQGTYVTTASDIYSLGVVLYQLLTNRRPYEVTTSTPLDIVRAVCETEPDPPGISGDLDNILMMALRKEPGRRYQSVQQFAEDIDRSLHGLPVLARRDTFAYRSGKFIRRNWVAVASVTAALAGLSVGTVLAVRQAQRAERRFAQVRNMAHKFLFDFHDDIESLPGATKAREHMVETAREYLDSLAAEAGGDPDLQMELATSYMRIAMIQGKPFRANLGQPQQAEANLAKSLAILEKLRSAAPESSAESRLKIMRLIVEARGERFWLLKNGGRIEDARRDAEQAVSMANELASMPAPAAADLRAAFIAENAYADLNMNEPSRKKAIAGFRRATELAGRLVALTGPSGRIAYGGSFNKLGLALEQAGEQKQAMAAYLEGIRITQELRKNDSSNIVINRNLIALTENASNLYWNHATPHLGDRARGAEYLRQMEAVVDAMYASDPKDQSVVHDRMDVLSRMMNHAWAAGNHREAIALGRRAIAFSKANQTDETARNYDQSCILLDLSEAHAEAGEFSEARRCLREGEAMVRKQIAQLSTQSSIERNLAVVRYREAQVALFERKAANAAAPAQSFLKSATEALAEAPDTFFLRYDLSAGYELMGRLAEAQGDEARRKEWQIKRLELWKDWDARFVPNPFSKLQQAEAEQALRGTLVSDVQ